MSVPAAAFLLAGCATALFATLGLLRLRSSYARFHAAGKASPVAFLLVSVGAGLETGWGGAARLAVAVAALVLTLPVGVHLLFRAVHRTTPRHLTRDDLADADRGGPPPPTPRPAPPTDGGSPP